LIFNKKACSFNILQSIFFATTEKQYYLIKCKDTIQNNMSARVSNFMIYKNADLENHFFAENGATFSPKKQCITKK